MTFNLWVLRAETGLVMNPNDNALHMAMVRWAHEKVVEGKIPLDGWYPYLSLGLAQFHHYQVLPHIITAYLSSPAGVQTTFVWANYLLLAFWPLSVFLGARLLNWDWWTAAMAAAISPLLVSVTGYGYEHSSYTWQGLGVYSQLWGMWLLPLSLGLTWRAVQGTSSLALAALVTALTMASHFLTGYLALLAIGIWVVMTPSKAPRSLLRAAVVGVGALLIAAWAFVPLIADSRYVGNIEFYLHTFWLDSFGAPKVLAWLVSGEIYDHGRIPVITLLVGVGIVVCAVRFRRDPRARALIGFWMLSLLLFFGRPTLGPLLNLLPGSSDLPFHRYLNGVHLGGIMLAAFGTVWMFGRVVSQVRERTAGLRWRWGPIYPEFAAAVVLAISLSAFLYPAWSQIAAYDDAGAAMIADQQQADATDGADLASLIGRAKVMGPGRGYAGTKTNWGREYRIGQVPVYLMLENYDVDAIGMWLNTQSLSSDVEVRFDENNLNDYDLFNIRYLFLPSDHQPSVAATLIATAGRHRLWQVDTTGYFEVVDSVSPPIVADRTEMGRQNAAFMASDQLARRQFPTIAFAGAAPAPPSLAPGASPSGPAGEVESESPAPSDGVFTARIVANREAVVLLKTTFDLRWRITLDGVHLPPEMVAPSFVGRRVAAGSHVITFEYVPYPSYPWLIGIALIALVALALGPRIRRLAPTQRTAQRGPRFTWKIWYSPPGER